jgi:2-polyprenyl-3-methyl-5-hydroxy-6-metoxy-1,4-benzoquinol methylase
MEPAYRPSPDDEIAQYETQDNDPADQRYRRFLDRLAQPLVARLPATATGLDYGAGPGPTLSIMLAEQGYNMTIYDPFYADHPEVLEHRYDFITCTETAEHFFRPGEEFKRLDKLSARGECALPSLRPQAPRSLFVLNAVVCPHSIWLCMMGGIHHHVLVKSERTHLQAATANSTSLGVW